jgi:hypothetical protein
LAYPWPNNEPQASFPGRRGHCEGRAMPWFDAIAVAVAFIAVAALVVAMMSGER